MTDNAGAGPSTDAPSPRSATTYDNKHVERERVLNLVRPVARPARGRVARICSRLFHRLNHTHDSGQGSAQTGQVI